MRVPKIFLPEKDLEKNILDLIDGPREKKSLSNHEIKSYYWKFVNLQSGKKFTVENIQDYFKDISYEDALRIADYEKRERNRFLDGLADIP